MLTGVAHQAKQAAWRCRTHTRAEGTEVGVESARRGHHSRKASMGTAAATEVGVQVGAPVLAGVRVVDCSQ